MTEGVFDDESVTGNDVCEQCRQIVIRVMERFGWQLLSVDEFTRRTAASVTRGEAPDPWRAAINVYCQCLYGACRGNEGRERQNLAFTELHRYLYGLSIRESSDLPPDVRAEVVNETLLRIWKKLDSYHTPGAFLAIAALELRNVLRPLWTRLAVAPPMELLDGRQTVTEDSDPEQSAIRADLRQQVQACFDEVLRRQPRARRQLEAVWLKFIAGLDDETISAYMARPVASVYVLRSRGLKQLRASPRWQQLAHDWGLT
ncbi:MAG: RNA polymerase sigma factor [Chloroflexaceae bacterium]